MRTVAWDTWAFVETARAGERADEIEALLAQSPRIVTSRDVVVETCNFLSRASARSALAWWDALRQSPVRVVDVPLAELRARVPERDLGRLTLTDLSLAHVAASLGTREVATEDGGFRALGLEPLFARR